MTTNGLAHHAEMSRAAIDAHDFPLAQIALQKYVICFRSRCRSIEEIDDARNLLQWGIAASKAQKAQLAEELMLVKRFFDAYRAPRRDHTWRIDA